MNINGKSSKNPNAYLDKLENELQSTVGMVCSVPTISELYLNWV